MDIAELEEMLEEHMPGMRITTLKSGEVVIYTGRKEDDDGELVPLDTEEVESDPDFDDMESYDEDDDDDLDD